MGEYGGCEMTKKDIKKKLQDLYATKEVAYRDWQDNRGNEETAERLWGVFDNARNRFNSLVTKYNRRVK